MGLDCDTLVGKNNLKATIMTAGDESLECFSVFQRK